MHALHGAVRKGNAEVLAVVQDGFSRISDAEVAAILDDWSGSRVHASVPWGLIVSGFGLLSLVLLGAFLCNFTLRRKVRVQDHDDTPLCDPGGGSSSGVSCGS